MKVHDTILTHSGYIFDDSFDLCGLTKLWFCLIMSTYSYWKSNIMTTICEVQQTINHTSINTLIHINSLIFFSYLDMSCNKCTLVSCTLKAKILHNVFGIFVWGHKYTLFHLFNLKPKEVSKFTTQTHFKFWLHLLNKMLYHLFWHSSKHDIIHINMRNH